MVDEHLLTQQQMEGIQKKMCIRDRPDGAPLIVNADNDLLSHAQVPARLRRVSLDVYKRQPLYSEPIISTKTNSVMESAIRGKAKRCRI